MSRTRPWWIISAMAVTQIALIAGYYTVLFSDAYSADAAQTVVAQMNPSVPPDAAMPDLVPVPQLNLPPGLALQEDHTAPGPLPQGIGYDEVIVTPPIPLPPQGSGPCLPITLVSGQEIPQLPTPQVEATQGLSPLPSVSLSKEDGRPPLPVLKHHKPNFDEVSAPQCPWNFAVKVIDGRTVLTAQFGPEVPFTVHCDRLDMQTANGLVQAMGKVELKAKDLSGSCDRLTFSWQEDAVTLTNARVQCTMNGQGADFQAAQLRLQMQPGLAPAQGTETDTSVSVPFPIKRSKT